MCHADVAESKNCNVNYLCILCRASCTSRHAVSVPQRFVTQPQCKTGGFKILANLTKSRW